MAVLIDVGILVLFATIAGVLANRFKTPPVLGLLLAGAVVGPHLLGLISQNDSINLFSEIGAILLLFAIGSEFSASKLAQMGIRVLAIAVLKLSIVFFLTFQLAVFLGFSQVGALYLGAILSITSTALMIKIVEQKNYLQRKEVPILIASLVIEDIFAVFALAVFSNIGNGQIQANAIAASISISILALVAAYIIVRKVLSFILDYFIKYQAAETMTLLALSVGVGFSYFAEVIGLTPSIGAFLAGSIVASLPKGELLEKSISPFILAFSSIFFLSIGMLIDVGSIQQNAWIIIVLVIANMLFKFIATSASTFLLGFTRSQAVFSGLAMLSVGEFSLIIAKEGSMAVGFDLLGTTAAIVFFSTLASAASLDKFEGLSGFLSKATPKAVRTTTKDVSKVFVGAIKSLESAGKTSFVAVKETIFYWIAAIGILVFGSIANLVPSLAGITILRFSIVQITVLAATAVFALGIRGSIIALAAKKQDRNIPRFASIVALSSLLLLLPFISSSFESSFEQSEFTLVAVAAVLLAYIMYSGKKEHDAQENILFFKKP